MRLRLARSILARSLVLTSANSRPCDLGALARATKVSVHLNRDKWFDASFDADELQPLCVDFGGRKRVRSLEIVVREIEDGSRRVLRKVGGFAEVALQK